MMSLSDFCGEPWCIGGDFIILVRLVSDGSAIVMIVSRLG